jgi:hypothetical protein
VRQRCRTFTLRPAVLMRSWGTSTGRHRLGREAGVASLAGLLPCGRYWDRTSDPCVVSAVLSR